MYLRALSNCIPKNNSKVVSQKQKNSGKRVVVSGQGDYSSFMKSISTAIKPMVKAGITSGLQAAGAATGLPGGSAVGSYLGSMLSKVIGSGDYTSNSPQDVKYNSLFKNGAKHLPTEFATDQHSLVIRHREYMGDLIAGPPNVFNITKFSINPGLCQLFPYTNQIAALFEEYQFHGLVFEYVSLTSPYLAGGAMGSVVMAANYNPYSPDYTSKTTMDNSSYAVSARPDQNLVYGIECAPDTNTNNKYLTRTGASLAPRSATDMGTFYVAHNTPIAQGSVLGEVWAVMDLCLTCPKALTANTPFAHSAITGNGNVPVTGIVSLNVANNIYEITSISVVGAVATVTVANVCAGDVFTVFYANQGSAAMGTTSTPAYLLSAYSNCAASSPDLSGGSGYTTPMPSAIAGSGITSVVGGGSLGVLYCTSPIGTGSVLSFTITATSAASGSNTGSGDIMVVKLSTFKTGSSRQI